MASVASEEEGLSLEALVTVESGLEPYVFQWQSGSEADGVAEALAYVVAKRMGGFLLALPIGFRGCAQQGKYWRGIRTPGGFNSFGCARHAHGRWHQIHHRHGFGSFGRGYGRAEGPEDIAMGTHLFNFRLQESSSLRLWSGCGESDEEAGLSYHIATGPEEEQPKQSANTGGMPEVSKAKEGDRYQPCSFNGSSTP